MINFTGSCCWTSFEYLVIVFQESHCASPTCLCQTGTEDNEHFLLHCPRFSLQRRPLLELVSKSTDVDIMRLSSNEMTNV